MIATIKKVKKNATKPTRITITMADVVNAVDNAAKAVRIVPIIPISRHPRFRRRHLIATQHDPVHELRSKVPRRYNKINTAKPKAIQIPLVISDIFPPENNIATTTPAIMPTIAPIKLQPPHTQL